MGSIPAGSIFIDVIGIGKRGMDMLKALFVINPSSGKQNFLETIERIISRLIMEQTVNHIDVVYTQKQQDAYEAAFALKKGEYDFVTAIGGDGTINEVIAGIAKSGCEIPVAVLSAGTINDFANYLHLPDTVLLRRPFCA